MKTPRGFGKANNIVAKEIMLGRIRSTSPEFKEKAEAMADPANLSELDWCYLAKDFAVMCSVFIEHELPAFKRQGGHFCREGDGTVTGLTFLKHRATDENVGVVLKQSAPGTPEYHAVEIFTVEPSGQTAIPDSDMDRASAVAEDTLNKSALAYSFLYDGEQQGMQAGYAWSNGHAEDKVQNSTPKGSKPIIPFPVSQHDSTVRAITFAHCLNKHSGVLFGGCKYEELESLLSMQTKQEEGR
jgi:hypothetical protein